MFQKMLQVGSGGGGTWTLVGSTQGTGVINIPLNIEELLISVSYENNVKWNIYIPYIDLKSDGVQYRTGSSSATNNLWSVTVNASKTSVNLIEFIGNSYNFSSTAYVYVYAR